MKRKSVNEIINKPHLVIASTLFGCSAYSLTYIDTFSDGQVGGESVCYICSLEIDKDLFRKLTDGFPASHCNDLGRIWDFGSVKKKVDSLKEEKYDIQENNFY